jgi:hypothetical protein
MVCEIIDMRTGVSSGAAASRCASCVHAGAQAIRRYFEVGFEWR